VTKHKKKKKRGKPFGREGKTQKRGPENDKRKFSPDHVPEILECRGDYYSFYKTKSEKDEQKGQTLAI
jgi:hypothetical protein